MGKVHGSLARAGKVKSQTPKVSLLLCPSWLGFRNTSPQFKPNNYFPPPFLGLQAGSINPLSNIYVSSWDGEHVGLTFCILCVYICIGWAPREEEDPQGPRQEENHIYPTIRQCYNDGWQAQG